MSELRAALAVVMILALPVALCGCPVAIVGGLAAAGGTGYAANQERGVSGTFDDLTIKTNIQNAWLQTNPLMQRDFTITVYEGRTLLTGMSPNPELKAQAAQIAAQTPGVRAVYNEIEVASAENAWASVKDTWISSQIRSNLVFASQVRSVNYTIETVNGSVYLIGSARTPAELDRVTEAARNVPNVKRVVSYVEIRPGAPVTAQPAPLTPPPASAQAPEAPPATAPATAVEVQKL
jgi:osmotically-inducible protein OsmY